ncbi:MAG TPA: RteC domain-containing protein [Sphingobacteriaceae bacterium]|nr:RteC domain-containing protein [Sphingobacteriaceae bacterium]
MKTFTERLYRALETELYDLSLRQTPESERIKEAIKLCKKAMGILKRQISIQLFESLDDEIAFFKNVKPVFYSKYIYYISLYNFHIKKPIGGEDALRDYISIELADLKRFFDHNQSFYQYYRTNDSHLDSVYFTRGNYDVFAEIEDFQGDELFSTSHDYKLSKIVANEKFRDFLLQQIKNIISDLNPIETPVIWTSNQSDLVELIYALVESGSFNNGNIEIKNLMDYFQSIFQVDLKYYYRKFSDISNRKKERTAFIDKLKICLIKRMDSKYEIKDFPLKRISYSD